MLCGLLSVEHPTNMPSYFVVSLFLSSVVVFTRAAIAGLIAGFILAAWISVGAMYYKNDVGEIPEDVFWLYRVRNKKNTHLKTMWLNSETQLYELAKYPYLPIISLSFVQV